MATPELYIAVFHHEYGVDCFTFHFVPNAKLKYPSPRKVAEHFNIDFEPEQGETFELVPAFGSQIETLAAEQIGRETAASADWWDESQEGWIGEDTEDDAECSVACVACGREDLPLHTDGRYGDCGPSPATSYVIEQFGLHAMKYRVEANSEAEAIVKLLDGEAEPVGQSHEYIEVAEDYGLPIDGNEELADALRKLDVRLGDGFIPSIRSIEQI